MSSNIEDLKSLLESMAKSGSNVNVGPGLSGFMGFSSTSEMKKYADDMKEMLSKDVEELASQEGGSSVTTIEVRGRKMVIPQAGPRRQNAVLFACLYAVGSPHVDLILRTLNAKAYFMAKDGGVTLAQLVIDEPKVPPVHDPAPSQEALGGRNILIDGGDAQKTCLVALRRADTGTHCRIGIPVGQSAEGGVTVKLADGKTVDVPANFVTWISGEAELLKIMTEIAQAKQ